MVPLKRNRWLNRILPGLFSLCLLWGTGVQSTPAQETPAISLESLIREVMEKNPEIEASRQQWAVAREEIPQARSLEDPQLSMTQWAIPSHLNIGDAGETWYGIGQSFPFPGKRTLRGLISAKTADAAEQDYLAKVREITARMKMAYYQFFLVQKSIDLHLEHQALLVTLIEIVNQKYAVGQVAQQDLLKAQVELSKLHNSLLVLEQEKVSAAAEINTLLNRQPDTALGRVEEVAYRPFSYALKDLTQQAFEARPELKAASLMIKKSEQVRALAEKNYFPDFMVEVSYWDVHTGPNQWMAMGRINLPWIFKGKYDARLRQASAEEAQARADQTALQKQTLFQLQDLFTKIKSAEQLMMAYQDGLLPQAEQSLESARIGYQAGKVDFLNLIDSERTLLDLKLEYFGTLGLFWQSVAQLERSVGADFNR